MLQPSAGGNLSDIADTRGARNDRTVPLSDDDPSCQLGVRSRRRLTRWVRAVIRSRSRWHAGQMPGWRERRMRTLGQPPGAASGASGAWPRPWAAPARPARP